ncbi:hypothetical protein ScPMuIL_005333 [Solemya velum]
MFSNHDLRQRNVDILPRAPREVESFPPELPAQNIADNLAGQGSRHRAESLSSRFNQKYLALFNFLQTCAYNSYTCTCGQDTGDFINSFYDLILGDLRQIVNCYFGGVSSELEPECSQAGRVKPNVFACGVVIFLLLLWKSY